MLLEGGPLWLYLPPRGTPFSGPLQVIRAFRDGDLLTIHQRETDKKTWRKNRDEREGEREMETEEERQMERNTKAEVQAVIEMVNPKGSQPCLLVGRTEAEAPGTLAT